MDPLLVSKNAFLTSGLDNSAPFAVHHTGEGEGFGGSIAENVCQQLDDVLVGMIVIVEENEVIEGL